MQSRARLLLGLTVLVPLLVFGTFSLRHDVKIDWTGATWLAAVPVLAGRITSFANKESGRLRSILYALWGPTLWCLLLMYGAGLLYLSVGLPATTYSEHMELVPEGWRALGAQTDELVAQVRAATGSQPLVVGMDRYETASELAFYSTNPAAAVRTRTTAHLFGKTGLMYERWFPLAQQAGRTLILIAWDRRDLSDQQISPYVDRLGPIREGILSRGGVPIRHYYYRIVYGYHMGGSIRP